MAKKAKKEKTPKYVFDGARDKKYVRCYREGRSTIVVEIWPTPEMKGDPKDIWDMPAVLGIETAIAQALLQSA